MKSKIKEQLAKANCSYPGELETNVSTILTKYWILFRREWSESF
ncbi:hypothetical protein IG3_05227 [Bacillus cereus HuA2-1]|uniref:Uncharacterized protein n=1 Tax=Bacillus cereus HuA2-1 TaxID=1053201 RepID=J9BCQ3_BACCE|nr:hypothetical protein IG3_05227 [Bacillus cereus HuA2-1]